MFQKAFILSLFLGCGFVLSAQNVDVKHYSFSLLLNDANDTIKGTAIIDLQSQHTNTQFALHLKSVQQGKGMTVKSVAGKNVQSFAHRNDSLYIRLQNTTPDSLITLTIRYAGVPQDGLIIAKNKWGDRTFFADNWPDRAHHWLPCNDDPADKASVEFKVTAPQHYKVISNGVLVAEKMAGNNLKETHWKESTPIPTKVMVIGAARFAVKQYADSSIADVSAWVYPQDSTKGFYDYALAPFILRFFNNYIGDYAFTKLANVQSKTIFGGMENASAIFYAENTVTGTRSSEGLIAHEIAHQWFGNTATEKSFAHLWLSEGFASYMTHLYLESKYGRDTLLNGLKKDRDKIVLFQKRWKQPVVDSTSELMDLLNANSYQKGSWVLHMLRTEVGDAVFQKIIQSYYQQYKGRNANTKDFQQIVEAATGKNWETFFHQWLSIPGHPQLQVQWQQTADRTIQVTVKQLQTTPFVFPLRIALRTQSGALPMHKLQITKREETFTLKGFPNIQQLALDPLTELLFEGNVAKGN